MDLPKRKPNRLSDYDYGAPGAYFVTVCTNDRRNLFWDDVGAGIARPQAIVLSRYGQIVKTAIQNIPLKYPAVAVDTYVIMPNHIHLLLHIRANDNGRPMVAPTISTIIQQFKGVVTKQIGFPVWQKLFHDHVIRGQRDYDEVWEYIENNPKKWQLDRLYQS